MSQYNNGTLLDIGMRTRTPGPLTSGYRGMTLTGTASAAIVGARYSWAPTITSGIGLVKVSPTLGALPPSLQVAPDGRISGRPTQPGVYNIVLQAIDATSQNATLHVRITVT